ncbi:MAG: DNA gyrase inhibitor YacG [Betaproteobacteria bacterium]
MPQQKKPPLVNCPHCGRATPWSADQLFRPFCSERCKMIDLGQWASEGYRIPTAQAERESGQDEIE